MKFKNFFVAILMIALPFIINAQFTFEGERVNDFSRSIELDLKFEKFDVYQFDHQALRSFLDNEDFESQITLKLDDDYSWRTRLVPFDLHSDNASIRVLLEDGEIEYPVPRNITFLGAVGGSNPGILKVHSNGDYLRIYLDDGNNPTYFVSLSKYLDGADSNLFVAFKERDQFADGDGQCGADLYPDVDSGEPAHNHDHSGHNDGARSAVGDCFTADMGIVHDYSMFVDQGSIQGCIDHAVDVMMDVATNYDYDAGGANFDDGVELNIVEQVISACADCDPWTDSTDPGDLLDEYRVWGQGGGFNVPIDWGQLWTDRDFDGTTVGLAYRASDLICGGSAYHVLQDYTNTDWQLRVLTAHEMGHNINLVHQSGSVIMRSSVNNTNTWHASSQTTGSAEVVNISACTPACFTPTCDEEVTDVVITNVDASGFDISWTATTEGNYRLRVRDESDMSIIHTLNTSSTTHTNINPAGWIICNTYMVIVENDCGGSDYSAPVSALISKTDLGCAEFSADECLGWGSQTINFTDLSLNATSWSWDFGDGSALSTLQNPAHTYSTAGVYDVVLTVNGGAHTTTKTSFITILPAGLAPPYLVADGGNMNDNDFGAKSTSSCGTIIWERGVPTSNYFSQPAGDNAWVTFLDSDLGRMDDGAYLYSPDFDFGASGDYTLCFELGMEIQFCNGPFAVQVQYSTDGGGAWTRLGAHGDPGWYNRGPTSGGCAIWTTIFADQTGWTFTGQGTDYDYDVSFLEGNSSVIFRFAFEVRGNASSGSGYTRDGAKVDDFKINFVADPLPVELITFDGKLDQNQIQLDWQTATENNNDYFLIEKSTDGRTFENLGTVQGAGNSFEIRDYRMIDKEPAIGVNYYRLTQFDFNGDYFVNEKIVAIEYSSDGEISVLPNPVKGKQIQLVYETNIAGKLKVDIYTATGQLVRQLNLQASAARNIYDINLADLSNGVYILNTTQQEKSQSLRFVKTN